MQSALLEVMQEHQVTIAHTTYPVPDPFLVMATQNPIESEGTYPLPEAQVDRFMLKILIDYPEHDEELTIVQRQLVAAPELREALSLDELQRAAARGARRLRRSVADQLRGRARDGDAQARGARASPSSRSTSPSARARAGRSASRRPHARSRSSAAATTSTPRTCSALAKDALATGSC